MSMVDEVMTWRDETVVVLTPIAVISVRRFVAMQRFLEKPISLNLE